VYSAFPANMLIVLLLSSILAVSVLNVAMWKCCAPIDF
jgi:hypothetical protein